MWIHEPGGMDEMNNYGERQEAKRNTWSRLHEKDYSAKRPGIG